jgi:ABC-type hemin transport system ATPase subunit
MHDWEAHRKSPELRQIVAEASRALALLDADRLEELARACESLSGLNQDRVELARQAREAIAEMAILGRVLEATRSNLNVMHRLRDLRQGRTGYGESDARPVQFQLTGGGSGHN